MRVNLFLFACLVSFGGLATSALAQPDAVESAGETAQSAESTEAAESTLSAGPAPRQPKRVVLARVGTDEITVQELLSYASSKVGLLDALTKEETKGQVLGEIVVSRLIYQAAKNEGLLTDDYTQVELDLAVSELKRRHFTVEAMPTEAELRAFYEKRIDHYSTPPYVRMSQILFAVEPDAEPEVRTEARRRAETALRRLGEGEAFDGLAGELTEHPDRKAKNGDVGFYPLVPGQWYYDAVVDLPVGGHSDILDTDTGFQILAVTDRREAEVVPFEQVASNVSQRWVVEEEIRLRNAYIKRLAQEIPVTIEAKTYAAAHPLMPGFTFGGGGL